MWGKSDFTQSIIPEVHSSDIQRDQMEGESYVTGSVTDELHSFDIRVDQI